MKKESHIDIDLPGITLEKALVLCRRVEELDAVIGTGIYLSEGRVRVYFQGALSEVAEAAKALMQTRDLCKRENKPS